MGMGEKKKKKSCGEKSDTKPVENKASEERIVILPI